MLSENSRIQAVFHRLQLKKTHTHTHHVAADRRLLPESQNKSIFTSVVWLGRIHMRINSRAAIVVATDSTVQKSREWEMGKMKGNIVAARGNPRGNDAGQTQIKIKNGHRGFTWRQQTLVPQWYEQQWQPQSSMTPAAPRLT